MLGTTLPPRQALGKKLEIRRDRPRRGREREEGDEKGVVPTSPGADLPEQG